MSRCHQMMKRMHARTWYSLWAVSEQQLWTPQDRWKDEDEGASSRHDLYEAECGMDDGCVCGSVRFVPGPSLARTLASEEKGLIM